MAPAGWLIDKSALVRLGDSPDADEWVTRIALGQVHITTVTRLEVGFSARNADDLRTAGRRPPLASMPIQYLTPTIEDRAAAVQLLLAERGHHRAAAIPDLLIAATAELLELTVLHLDKDFELISEVTGQPVERLRVDAT